MTNVKVTILGGKYSQKRTNSIVIEMAANETVSEIIKNAKPIILEPFVDMTISSPKGKIIIYIIFTNYSLEYSKDIMNELITMRRGRVDMMQEEKDRFGKARSERQELKCKVPLIETVGYSSQLRSISKVIAK